jgi:6-phosphogluconolactonase
MVQRKVHIYKTPDTLSEHLALRILKLFKNAEKMDTDFHIALSGGRTPVLLFQSIVKNRDYIRNWSRIHFYWVDERCVPPDHAESNFRMVNDSLLKYIDVPQDNIFRIRGEDDPVNEAFRYGNMIRRYLPSRNSWPVFNLILLGMGSDGHTASIFPGQVELFAAEHICESTIQPVTGQNRITLTGNVINNAINIFFMVTGEDKSVMISKVFNPSEETDLLPVSHVKPVNGMVEWYIDHEAGKYIKKTVPSSRDRLFKIPGLNRDGPGVFS